MLWHLQTFTGTSPSHSYPPSVLAGKWYNDACKAAGWEACIGAFSHV